MLNTSDETTSLCLVYHATLSCHAKLMLLEPEKTRLPMRGYKKALF